MPLAVVPSGAGGMEIAAIGAETTLARVDSDVSSKDGGEDAEEEGEAPPQLPEGFFDDPEQDAKARGVEAPSVKAQRELEEGLKRFEKEMLVEREKAEEARNELEEDRAEEQAVEEEDLQRDLKGRLEALRQRKKEVYAKSTVEKVEKDEQPAAAHGDEEAEDSDSD